MNIDNLTYAELKEIAALFNSANPQSTATDNFGGFIGQKVIIRTYSAGVWFGTLEEKAKNEVILKDAKRLWRWWAAESISLSAVAKFGVKPEKSKIAPAVEKVWLEAIEIIPCTEAAIESIESCEDAIAE